jgi:hypothetical protein
VKLLVTGLRFGATNYMGTTTRDVDPRILIGGYYHFGESDTHRWEAGIDLTPDLDNFGENGYKVVSGHYMGFIGDRGLFYWKAGGGAIYETRGSASETFGLLEAGGGMWLEMGQDSGIFAGLTLQLPIGSDVNAPTVLVINGGLDS